MGWLFFFNDTATTEIYTLSLHDALPIYEEAFGSYLLDPAHAQLAGYVGWFMNRRDAVLTCANLSAPQFCTAFRDRKSTRLNSSHANISYAVFCLKKKKICNIFLSLFLPP